MLDASEFPGINLDAVGDSIAAAASTAKQKAGSVLGEAADALEQLSDDFRSDTRAVSRKAKRAVSESRRYLDSNDLEDMASDVLDAVRKHPGKAIFAVAAVGLLVGSLLRRNR